MMKIKIFTHLLALLLAWPLAAQQTTVYTEADLAYKRGQDFMGQSLFAKAKAEYQKAIDLLRPVHEPEAELLRPRAEFGYAKSAVLLEQLDGEKLMLDFIRRYSPDPIANDALIEMANYYFNTGKYEKAIEYYALAPTGNLSRNQRAEVRFRMGYSFFVQKQFAKAKSNFNEVKDVQNEYYHATNYYLGLCHFFDGEYNPAIKYLRIAEGNRRYQPHIPYYLTQIYFAERRYDELIAYAEPRLGTSDVRNDKEMRQLIGQSYFEKGDYQRALPYLEYYAERSGKLREEEFYQIGFAQYKTGNCRKAIANFKEISTLDSQIGQSASYYLADCYIKEGKKTDARTAFGYAKRLFYDRQMREEALFNYAKLSYELKDSREAIASLQEIQPTSPFYNEAQGLMGEVFLSYRDYRQALEVLDKMPTKTPQLQATYQKVAYYRALQLLQANDKGEAKKHFNKSLQFPVDPTTRALTNYWLGDIAHSEKQYDTSIRLVDQFLTAAKTLQKLPEESSLFTGNYLQGYNYMKKANYPTALNFFRQTVEGIKRNRAFISSNEVKNKVLGDATVRAGDCHFKANQYNEAFKYYDEAISAKYAGFEYAIYQKAIIEGLRGRTTDKILALERLPREFPNSEFADDALLQLGVTYQEIGQLSKAVEPLRQLITDYKGKSDLVTEGLLQLGLITYNQGNLETALNYYKQVFSNNPTPSEATRALAALEEIYVNDMGKPDQYFAFLETVPGYKVDNMARDSISFRAAESQFENANYARAVEAYSDYLRKFPNGRSTLRAYYQRGESHSVLRQYPQALADYEYVVGKGASAFYVRALEKAAIIAYNSSQDFKKAYDLYVKLETAATSDDMRFEAELGAMRSAYRSNNKQGVTIMADKVIRSANATQAQKATANFYLGKAAYDARDFQNALTYFERVVQTSDNEQTAEARYLIADIYYQRRELNRAQQLCLNANKESSGYPYWVAKSIILLSDVLSEKGDLFNARAALEALIENYDEDQEVVNTAKTKLAAINQKLNNSSRLAPTAPGSGRMELIDGN